MKRKQHFELFDTDEGDIYSPIDEDSFLTPREE